MGIQRLAWFLFVVVPAVAAPWTFPCPENEIASYTAHRVKAPPTVDGRLDEPAWQQARRSPRFVDIISGGRTLHNTQAAVLWDEENLYVGFWVEEPLLHAKYTNHNDPIYYDNDVEVFIAGRDAYYEFEINGFNTVYEAFFIWQDVYESGGFAAAPEFASAKLKSFNGVGFTNHARGLRWGAFDWTFPDKRTAVFLDGTVNDDKDRDRGWTVELAFPWKSMNWLAKADGRSLPPKDGDVWRMDFSRFNTYKEPPPAKDSGGWVWTRHGIWDSHIPECFAKVRFSAAEPSDDFVDLFDGSTLNGWKAPDPTYWSVEDGAIVGRITKEHVCNTNQYLVWQGGDLADFELKLKSRLNGEGGINNGFQFRSRVLPDGDVAGYQMDNNLQTPWLVRLYDEFGRHTLAWRGQHTTFATNGEATHAKIAEAEGPAAFKLEDWHEYHLICEGPRLTLRVNGALVAEVLDHDLRRADAQGVLALQLHSGPPTVVQFKDVRLKVLNKAAPAKPPEPLEMSLQDAWGAWDLGVGGHEVRNPLRYVGSLEHSEFNVRANGPGARNDARVTVLSGGHFNAGRSWNVNGEAISIYLRARDPEGKWDSALFGKRGSQENLHYNLSSQAGVIGFEIRTAAGLASVRFPVREEIRKDWLDLVARYDGVTVEIYCNGKLMAAQPWKGKLMGNDEPLLIGAETDQGKVVRPFRGELEAAAIWTRALTSKEIARQ